MPAHAPPSLSALHRLWRLLPAVQRRSLFAAAAGLLAAGRPLAARGSSMAPTGAAPTGADGAIVAGEFSRASGVGETARLMHAALGTLRLPAAAIDIAPLLPAHRADLPAPEPQPAPPGAPLVLHVNAPLLPWVLLRLPRALARGRRIIGYWAWELPVPSPDWAPGARLVHEIWTPSRFVADALSPLLPGRVRVVPPPLAAVPPRPAPLDRAAFGLPDHAVVVLTALNLASSFERKNPLAAIAAFRAAFGHRADRLLVLKLGNPEHAPADFARIRAAVAGAANIRLETRTLPAASSHALTAAADIVLSLHRSEGFGLVPAEAMLLGRPVIATGWSGNLTFMDADSAALVGYRLVAAHDARGLYALPGALWAEPDLGEAAAWLRHLAADRAARAALGARGRQTAHRRLGIGPLANALGVGGAAA